jgi:transcriptional regulator with XRE-family HTH domain
MTKKSVTTFEREMQHPEFKEAFEEGYKEFLLSELLIDLMTESHKSVRKLAEEVGLSPTVIQKVRSGKQSDLKAMNLINIAEACGYRITFVNEKKPSKKIFFSEGHFARSKTRQHLPVIPPQ